MRNMDREALRESLKSYLEKLEKKDLIMLMSLPNHLRETMLAILVLEEATASDVAEVTGKSRPSESDYLNQLERMGYLKRRYTKRSVKFSSLLEGEEPGGLPIL